ncbi:MAG: EamA family transporter [Chloroflexota bacterium]
MAFNPPSRPLAIAEATLVAIIWASSFVFIKLTLPYVGPLTLAGTRYFLGFLLLLPIWLVRRNDGHGLSPRSFGRLFLLGVSSFTLGNGALFWGLKYLPATTGSFSLSLIPILVLIGSLVWLREVPTRWQVLGMFVALVGGVLFFSPGLKVGEPLGIGLVSVGLIGFSLFGLLGRDIAREHSVNTLTLTTLPLAFGGGLTLLIALSFEGVSGFTWKAFSFIVTLAVVHTALAYILYNHSLQTLTALEINIALNLIPVGTAVFAYFLLGEELHLVQIIGMVVVVVGVALVQAGSENQVGSEHA